MSSSTTAQERSVTFEEALAALRELEGEEVRVLVWPGPSKDDAGATLYGTLRAENRHDDPLPIIEYGLEDGGGVVGAFRFPLIAAHLCSVDDEGVEVATPDGLSFLICRFG